jgi:hypothetical protein
MKYVISIIAITIAISFNCMAQDQHNQWFTPNDSLTLNFHSHISSIGKNVQSKDIDAVTDEFDSLLLSNKINDFYISQICNILNYYVTKKAKVANYYDVISSFRAMLSADFSEEDCKSWVSSIIEIEPASIFIAGWRDFFKNKTISATTSFHWEIAQASRISLDYTDNILYINIEDAKLQCPVNDSIIIYNTSGRINFYDKKWYGSKGKINWQKAGLDTSIVYVTLPPHFTASLDNVYITIDSVLLYHKDYFAGNAYSGSITDRCVQGANKDNSRFPKFQPYSNQTEIVNLYPDVNFFGGFALEGNRIIGTASSGEDAQITFFYNDTAFIYLSSKRFNISPDNFSSNSTEVEIITRRDTISHNNSAINYRTDKNQLTITRDPNDAGSQPFVSIYHKLNIFSDEINWNIGSDYLKFSATSTFAKEGDAFFESWNFFSKKRFRQFETADGKNSIITVLRYAKKYSTEFSLDDFVWFCKMGYAQVKTEILNLADLGVITYDPDTERITVTQKLYDYVNAYNEKIDYDILTMSSHIVNDDNAVLSLKDDILTLKGVESVTFSRKDNVILFPDSQTLHVKNDMNMEFSGYLQAGLIDFFVKFGRFNYSRFDMNLSQIDSLLFYVATDKIDSRGRVIVDKIQSPIRDLSGVLEINKSFNKSGNSDDYPEYPIFTCTDSAFIYYDSPNICDGVYNHERFYFLLDPFSIDSLQTFVPDHVSFAGTCVSGGIFEDFRQPITILPNKSLGFTHQLPDSGYAIYGGKGRFYNTISLSNECFRGSGQLDYLTAELKSEDFVFFPDSANAVVERVVIEEQVSPIEYPYIEGSSSFMHWDVEPNVMTFNTLTSDPYYLYHDFVALKGKLYYSPEIIRGSGNIINGLGNISSDDYHFKLWSFSADDTDFSYYLPDNKHTSVDALAYNLNMDVKTKVGNFNANDEKTSIINFNENAYTVNYANYLWDINKNKLILGSPQNFPPHTHDSSLFRILDLPPEGATAIAQSKKAKGLQFNTIAGEFNCETNLLSFNGVEYIIVSDASIMPVDKSVIITSGGGMMPINNAFAIYNIKEKHHLFYSTNANIQSREVFTGSGYYDYKDNKGNVTIVFVESMSSNADKVTAKAIIPELNPLPLNAVVDFQGTLSMSNLSKELELKGFYHVKQPCFDNETWVQFAYSTNPQDLTLPINKQFLSKDGKEIQAGVMFSNPGAIIYPAFISTKNKIPDFPIINVGGLLRFNGNKYTVTDDSKTYAVNDTRHVTLDVERCLLEGSDILHFLETKSRFNFNTAGSLRYFIPADSIEIEMSLFTDFHFNKQALKIMAEDLAVSNWVYTPPAANKYYSALNFLLPSSEFQRYYTDINSYGGSTTTPKILNSTIVISNVKLTWDNKAKVFYSIGPITVASIDGITVNKTVKGVIEISKQGGTEAVTIMLISKNELGVSNKYFFFYHNNNMFTYSTNEDFTNLIRNDKTNVRRIKRSKGMPPYQYIIATSERLWQFCAQYGL